MIDFHQFHFLRPEWLLALIPLAAGVFLLLRKQRIGRGWQSVVDAKLLPHLLIGKAAHGRRFPAVLFALVGLPVIVALAGPAWEKRPQPVYRDQSALVILLDLSRSMDATDLKPSRLARARYKVSDILKMRAEGQTALIAYAADAFAVSPLTDDTDTIDALVPSLSSDIMPAQGSRIDLALQKAGELFNNAGVTRGDVLLITDGIDADRSGAFDELAGAGHRLSILAVGTGQGAPVALADGGFLKDNQGAIVVPKLDSDLLRKTALAGGGRFSLISADDMDIKHLLGLLEINRLDSATRQSEMQADQWREQGPWLLLIAIPLAALAFRRGLLALALLVILPWSPPADALSWDDLWKNHNQMAAEKLQREEAADAARLFTDPKWKSAAHYRAGEYEQAARALKGIDNAEAHYNRGNALAKLGRLPEAIDAYRQALSLDPAHEDAQFNKQLLEQQLEQQPENQQDRQQQDKDDSEQQQGDRQQQSQQQQGQGQQEQQQDGEQQQSGQQQDERQASDSSARQDGDQDRDGGESQQQNTGERQPQQEAQSAEPSTDEQAANDETQQRRALSERQQLSQQAAEQWLRRIPDDPGGLLRRKFKYQYQRQQQQSDETHPW